MRSYIYGLVDPIDNQLRYIGKSLNGLKAANRHCTPFELNKRSHKNNWIKSVLKQEYRPVLIIIQEFIESDILSQAEIFWIKYFKAMGCQLTNATLGGEGTPGLVFTDKHLQNLRKAKFNNPNNHKNSKISEEHKN